MTKENKIGNIEKQVIDLLIDKSKFKISNYVLEKEKENIFNAFLEKNNLEKIKMKDLAEMLEKTEEEINKDFLEMAGNKIKSYLILNEINKKENIVEEENNEDI